jgi:hypothetical protein
MYEVTCQVRLRRTVAGCLQNVIEMLENRQKCRQITHFVRVVSCVAGVFNQILMKRVIFLFALLVGCI